MSDEMTVNERIYWLNRQATQYEDRSKSAWASMCMAADLGGF